MLCYMGTVGRGGHGVERKGRWKGDAPLHGRAEPGGGGGGFEGTMKHGPEGDGGTGQGGGAPKCGPAGFFFGGGTGDRVLRSTDLRGTEGAGLGEDMQGGSGQGNGREGVPRSMNLPDGERWRGEGQCGKGVAYQHGPYLLSSDGR